MGLGIGVWEMLFIFLVVLLLFGAKRLPEIGSSLGKGIREFKGSLREIEGEIKGEGVEGRGGREVRDGREGRTSVPPASEQKSESAEERRLTSSS